MTKLNFSIWSEPDWLVLVPRVQSSNYDADLATTHPHDKKQKYNLEWPYLKESCTFWWYWTTMSKCEIVKPLMSSKTRKIICQGVSAAGGILPRRTFRKIILFRWRSIFVIMIQKVTEFTPDAEVWWTSLHLIFPLYQHHHEQRSQTDDAKLIEHSLLVVSYLTRNSYVIAIKFMFWCSNIIKFCTSFWMALFMNVHVQEE